MKSLHKAFLFIVLLGITIALLSHWHEHRNDNSTYLEQLEHIIQQMTKQEGVTEVLKATDQMAWVARMNSIRNRAEEIVLHDLVYC